MAQRAAWIDTARDRAGGARDVARPGVRLPWVAIHPVQAETVPQNIVVEIAWWFDGPVDEVALESAATDVHRRHQALHARYLSGPDLGLAEVPADPGRVEFVRLEQDSDDAAVEALRQALRAPLSLGEGKIWRCVLVRNRHSGRILFGLAHFEQASTAKRCGFPRGGADPVRWGWRAALLRGMRLP